VPDFPQKVKVEDLKTKLSCETYKEAFVQDFPHKVKVEDVETKLLCETSFSKFIRSSQFSSIQVNSSHSIHSFIVSFLAIINIRNTEVPSNFR